MIMIWWTWAATWRSPPPPPRPPLQIIIAIIIVTFYSIFFCFSIWILIRVCVGHSPRHPTFIIVSLLKARGLTPPLWGRQNGNLWGHGTEGRRGFEKCLYQLDFHWIGPLFFFLLPSSSEYPTLRLVLVPPVFLWSCNRVLIGILGLCWVSIYGNTCWV